jgi:hypothetical protein
MALKRGDGKINRHPSKFTTQETKKRETVELFIGM